MVILVDNGHGVWTSGKSSPDGRLREGVWARKVASCIVAELQRRGVDARLLTPEDADVSISERVRRANKVCAEVGATNVALISVHVNAAASHGWHNARGWFCIVDDAASTRAKRLADLLWTEAVRLGISTRQPMPGRRWWLYGEAFGVKGKRLGILRGTQCAAVLTENLFMDNPQDVEWLLTPEGVASIVMVHVEAVMRFVKP